MQSMRFLKTYVHGRGGRPGTLAGLALLLLLAAKCWVDFDPSWDSWWYHVPFAARIWGIVGPESYQFEPVIQRYYEGMPQLAEFVQGFFWRVTGHVQATNFACFFSLAAYVFFLRARFGLNLGVVVVSLLGIPLVMIHAVSSYVDLPGNLVVAAMAMLGWQWLMGVAITRRDMLVIAVLACVAANCKVLLIPVVVLMMAVALGYGLCCRQLAAMRPRVLDWAFFALMVAGVLFVPARNYIVYGNFVYPVQLVSSDVQTGYDVNTTRLLNETIKSDWFISVFETGRPFGAWSIDQLQFLDHVENRLGGYCAPFVVVQLLLFGVLCWRRNNRGAAGLLFFVLTFAAATLPRPMEMRYHMFWIVWLVSVNLVMLKDAALWRVVVTANALEFAVVVWMTGGFYVWPQGLGMHDIGAVIQKPFVDEAGFEMVPKGINGGLLEGVKAGERLCITRQQPLTFLYADYFHKGGAYTVAAAYWSGECPAGTRHAGEP